MDLLQQARETINGIDAQMAALFEQRMRAVQAVAEYKKEHGLPILDAAREEAVLPAEPCVWRTASCRSIILIL